MTYGFSILCSFPGVDIETFLHSTYKFLDDEYASSLSSSTSSLEDLAVSPSAAADDTETAKKVEREEEGGVEGRGGERTESRDCDLLPALKNDVTLTDNTSSSSSKIVNGESLANLGGGAFPVVNESALIQLAQCRFPGQAISNSKILIYFSNKIQGGPKKPDCFQT